MIELDTDSKLAGPGPAPPVEAPRRPHASTGLREPLPAARPSRGWRLAYEWVAMAVAVLSFVICVAVGTAAIAAGVFIADPEARGRRARRLASLTFASFLQVLSFLRLARLDLSALDRLAEEGSLVVAPNHPSMMDAVLTISRMPDAICIMKSTIGQNWLLGIGARLSGYIRNDRPHTMIRESIAAVRAGHQLLIFPEGTRTRQFPVSELAGAFALIARRARAPVQVVVIETNSRFLAKGWPLWRKPDFPLVYRARLGARIEPGHTDEEILALTAQNLHAELETR